MAQADEWRRIYEEYERDWSEWDALAKHVRTTVDDLLSKESIHAWVFARAKVAESFTRKVVVESKTPAEVGDCAGVRVVLPYESQIQEVERLLRERFTLIRREQKRDALAYNEVGYLGVHLDLRLRATDPEVERFGTRPFELQLRTIAQAAWAEVSHEQLYKPPADVPDELKRRIYRLVALVELFDNEVAAFTSEATSTPGYQEASALGQLERELRERFGVLSIGDRRISRELAAALVPLYGATSPETLYEDTLAAWVDEHESDLRVQLERGRQARHPLIGQPEVLIIFERLDNAPAALSEAWPESIPRALLLDFAEMWGTEIPAEVE